RACMPSCHVLNCSAAHRDLHPFPTRRSSDLSMITSMSSTGRSIRGSSRPLTVMGMLAAAINHADTCAAATRNMTMAEVLPADNRSEEHTSELQSRENLVCRLLLERKKKIRNR